MKKITFLRHYKLEFPYDDWKNENYNEYIRFIEGKVNPHIQRETISSFIETELSDFDINQFELIITSNLFRTIETAEALQRYYKSNIEIVHENLFTEIPSRIIGEFTTEMFNEMKLIGKQAVKRERVLNTEQKVQRLKEIDKFLNQIDNNVLVISHGYLIGLLNYYYNIIGQDVSNFDDKVCDNYELGGYIKGFTVMM